jgi:hypothetical protein
VRGVKHFKGDRVDTENEVALLEKWFKGWGQACQSHLHGSKER